MLKTKNTLLILIITLTIFNILLVIFYSSLSKLGDRIVHQESNNYYAVYLINKEVYFGQIKKINSDILVLKDVFFLETFTPTSQSISSGEEMQVSPQKAYQLVRRGDDNLTLTDNVLFINRSAVLFWEKLGEESEIMQWIKKTKR
ncbi:MAG: hypothetical protein N2259_00210 [Patescibacteria group bacterium]|nr:hypothetical protein [Patescibacteria group bacterium]